MKNKLAIVSIGLALTAMALPVQAKTIIIEGSPCPLTIFSSDISIEDAKNYKENPVEEETEAEVTEEWAEEEETAAPYTEVLATTLEVYGTSGTDAVLVSCEDVSGYVLASDFEEQLPEIELSSLPDLEEYPTVVQGTNGEEAAKVQQALIDLGYLEGTADGAYFGGTAEAVRKFQEEHDLPQTGDADPITRLVLAGGEADNEPITLTYPNVVTVEKKFAAICENTEADLEPYLTCRFSFDSTTNTGTIDPSVSIGSFTSPEGAPDIEKISIKTSYAINVAAEEEDGPYVLTPTISIESAGVLRPYAEKLILTSAEETIELTDVLRTGDLDGITVIEHAQFLVSEEAEALLAEAEDLTVTLVGKNEEWTLS